MASGLTTNDRRRLAGIASRKASRPASRPARARGFSSLAKLAAQDVAVVVLLLPGSMGSRIIGCRAEKPDLTGVVGFFQRLRSLLVADMMSLFTDRHTGRFWKPFLYLSFFAFLVTLATSRHLPRQMFLLRSAVRPAPPESELPSLAPPAARPSDPAVVPAPATPAPGAPRESLPAPQGQPSPAPAQPAPSRTI